VRQASPDGPKDIALGSSVQVGRTAWSTDFLKMDAHRVGSSPMMAPTLRIRVMGFAAGLP
jgi:hypothetical protein